MKGFFGLTCIIGIVCAELKVLSDEALKEMVQSGDPLVVTFSRMNCDICDELITSLSKLSDEMESVSFSNIRGDLDPGLMDDLRIREYPTTIMFRHGHPEIYTDKNHTDAASLKSFVETILYRTTVHFIEKNELISTVRHSLEEDKAVTYVAELTSSDSDGAALYEETATGFRAVAQYYAFVNPIAHKETLKVYRPGEGKFEEGVYEPVATLSRLTPGRMSKFIRAELVGPYELPRPHFFYMGADLLFYAGTEEELEAARPILEPIGKKSRPDFHIVRLALPEWEKFATETIGMPGPFPQMMATFHAHTHTRRYLYDGEIREESVNDFMQDARDNRLERYFRSEDVEDKSDNAKSTVKRPINVLKLVNKNIKETIVDNKQHHFFTLVHAAWCEHCQPALDAFYRVAREYLDTDHVMFGTFEASKNDPPNKEFTTPSYPTLFHAAAGSGFSMELRMPISYNSLIDQVEDSLEGERMMIERQLRKHFDDGEDEEEEEELDDTQPRDEL